jgi:hypothetical protein
VLVLLQLFYQGGHPIGKSSQVVISASFTNFEMANISLKEILGIEETLVMDLG